MFEVVQFFNIKDITQIATSSGVQTNGQSKEDESNEDSFVSSHVSYARDTDSNCDD